MATIKEILSKPLEERKGSIYNATAKGNIGEIKIDNETFSGYGAFSFLYELSYVEQPKRGGDGSIDDLDTYAVFLTPHLIINFGIMSIDDYRTIMEMLYSKREFAVTCYDVVYNKSSTHNMYFATEQMPKLMAIARALNGDDSWVELYGVEDYTVELIGTNTEVEVVNVSFVLNVPSDAVWSGDTIDTVSSPKNVSIKISPLFNDGTEEKSVQNITFGDKYKIKYWAKNSDGSGFKYVNNGEYLFFQDTVLYAIWEAGA